MKCLVGIIFHQLLKNQAEQRVDGLEHATV